MKRNLKTKILLIFGILLIPFYFIFSNSNFETEIKSEFTEANSIGELFLHENYLFFNEDGNKLGIMDVSNPNSLDQITSFEGFNGISDIFVSGNFAYVVDRKLGFSILNISILSTPKIVGSFPNVSSDSYIYVEGKYAVISQYESEILLLDLSNPIKPILVSQFPTTQWYFRSYMQDNIAFIANNYSGLAVYDISSSANPHHGSTIQGSEVISGIFVNEEIAYVTVPQKGFYMYNISNPARPNLIGHYEVNAYFQKLDFFDRQIMVSYSNGIIEVLDQSDLHNIEVIGRFDSALTASQDFACNENFCYLSRGSEGLFVLQVKLPKVYSIFLILEIPILIALISISIVNRVKNVRIASMKQRNNEEMTSYASELDLQFQNWENLANLDAKKKS
ncbi:LVIVD repeat-containing protein [Candidatus Lokiarchaeum ossiferum]|uniref:LVIVD repeat-containing protein n=1 Tax=Candidatus Lokiarchaeum ossiferum TaxID=2951803 RepID=UPI00352D967F